MSHPSNDEPFSTSGPGSRIVSIHGDRRVKVYPVMEPELTTISYMNTTTTVAFSIGSFFLNMGLNPISYPYLGISSVFFIAGGMAFLSKKSVTDKIKKEASSIELE